MAGVKEKLRGARGEVFDAPKPHSKAPSAWRVHLASSWTQDEAVGSTPVCGPCPHKCWARLWAYLTGAAASSTHCPSRRPAPRCVSPSRCVLRSGNAFFALGEEGARGCFLTGGATLSHAARRRPWLLFSVGHAQVTHEAFQDGLFTAEELAATVGELRAEYVAALAALGVDAASLPDPTTDPPRPASRTDMFKVCGAPGKQAGPPPPQAPCSCFESVALLFALLPLTLAHALMQAFPDRPASSSGASSSGRVRAEHEPLQSQQQPQQRWSGRASTPVQAEARPQSHRWGGDVSPPGVCAWVPCFLSLDGPLTVPRPVSRFGAPIQAGARLIRAQQPRRVAPPRWPCRTGC